MPSEYLTIPEELAAANLAIENGITNVQIRPLLEGVGYTLGKMEIGRGRYQRASALTVTQTSEHGQQHGATDGKNTAWDEAIEVYMSDLKLARLAIKGRGDRDRMLLDGDRKDSYAGRKAQADQFYTVAIQDAALQTQLLEVNLTLAKLQAHQTLIDTAEEARLAQANEKGEAEDSTEARDAALAELRAWMHDYIAAAHVALQDHPQLLEALGIVARSGAAAPKADPTPPTPVS